MTDSVEAIVAEMRATRGYRALAEWADRLQSAHDAEVGALREDNAILSGVNEQLSAAIDTMTPLVEALTIANESAESRLREAERDARLEVVECANCECLYDAEIVGCPECHMGESQEVEKDAERLDWLAREFERNGTISFERYSVGVAGCQIFTVSTQHVRGYELRGAIDRAMELAGDGNG